LEKNGESHLTEYNTIEEVLERLEKTDRSLICTLKTRQRKWIGHALRGENRC